MAHPPLIMSRIQEWDTCATTVRSIGIAQEGDPASKCQGVLACFSFTLILVFWGACVTGGGGEGTGGWITK